MDNAIGGAFYEKYFEPRSYLDDYFDFGKNSVGNECLNLTLPFLCRVFGEGGLSGDTLIDIGSGPSIHQLLSACEAFMNITATDYSKQSRQELEKWLKNESGAFDWKPVVKTVCELEGNRMSIQDKEEKLRRVVKQVLPCDLLKTNPLEPLVLPQFDCVLSSFCLEVACKTNDEVCLAVKNMSNLTKPGGHLVLCGAARCSHYQVGEVMFTAMAVDEGILRKAASEAGYTIESLKVDSREDPKTVRETTDFSCMYLMVARKA
ncbi:nicotinamide N-methyltransferase-like isoform X2 [Ambystoma mexicanum]|uniref:nicotinamide N-methyltransferase-like isoform X1 n=1 Tax=Ambystoma mexicanum TaxID=8296 RepID=UPI0037E78D22